MKSNANRRKNKTFELHSFVLFQRVKSQFKRTKLRLDFKVPSRKQHSKLTPHEHVEPASLTV